MSKKIIFSLLLSLAFLLLPFFVVAQKPVDWEPPEASGVYDVPGHKNLKVRVFVHNPPTQSPALISCSQDVTSGPQDGVTGWHLPSKWSYYLNVSSAPGTVSSNLTTIASKAFNTWQSPLTEKVSFSYVGPTGLSRKGLDGKNIIAWGRTSGTALAVTYTWYYTSTGIAAETDTIFNQKFPWGWSTNLCDSSYYDAQDILTHELGHWTGLDDEYDSSFSENTMFGYGSKGEIKKDTLTTGDISGLNTIY